jgi:hypothetical protein
MKLSIILDGLALAAVEEHKIVERESDGDRLRKLTQVLLDHKIPSIQVL